MKLLYALFILVLTSNIVTGKNVSSNQQKALSKQLSTSHANIRQWEKKLTKQQRLSIDPLLSMYDNAYKDYKSNKNNIDNQSLATDATKAVEHVMNNWDSFFKKHIAIE